ncbi:MAG: ribonuclease HII, partial [Capnocytophaga ochracea]
MEDLALQFPEYHWQQNKGYPTSEHRKAIAEHGTTEHHRKTFQLLPVEQLSLF